MSKPQKSRVKHLDSRAQNTHAPFRFKQFHVQQQQAAMKIGFDGILVGAWCCVDGYKRILDIGTGTGLIALMVAQRTVSSVRIDAVEVDAAAALEARGNFENSPWKERLRLFHQAFQTWRIDQQEQFDLLVCNPPFFTSHRSNTPRAVARQESLMTSVDLFDGARSLLTPEGRLCLIVPIDRESATIELAQERNLFPLRKLLVRSMPRKPPHRVLLDFGRQKSKCEVTEIAIEESRHVYTPEFQELTRDFYLKF